MLATMTFSPEKYTILLPVYSSLPLWFYTDAQSERKPGSVVGTLAAMCHAARCICLPDARGH